MSQEKSGGPAFPEGGFIQPNGDFQWPEHGMTKLEWFAGQALNGILSNAEMNVERDPGGVVTICYEWALLMLQESERRSK
jgi:hypothetical protein